MTEPILQVRDLTTRFRTDRGVVTAVDRVSFDVNAGRPSRSSENRDRERA
jgi:oligopeptide transport system ATP-binding protein